MHSMNEDEIRQAVREQYGEVATGAAGCGSSCCGTSEVGEVELSRRIGYTAEELAGIPQGANMGLGCGNPGAIAALKTGETVLDLGSGGGFDCFLAARQVGDGGRVLGVDMTPEMLTKARNNALQGDYANVEFRLGEIEHLPVADASVDAIISNCVINLSPDKAQVFREAFRVLKPGGRLAVSDIVATAQMPAELRNDLAHYTGCMAGASTIAEIEAMLADAGFVAIRIAEKNGGSAFMREWAPQSRPDDYLMSADIRAMRPHA